MREKLLMNSGWRYYFGEPAYPLPEGKSFDQVYRSSRAENARGPARKDFDDQDWRTLTIPHDFVNELDVLHPEYRLQHAKDRGSAWYRRYFRLEESDKDKRILLHFDAVGIKAEVYVNSMLMRKSETSSIGFSVDITPVARFGDDLNVVSVHCSCHEYEAWYYEGGGIYRNVYLIKTDNLAVDTWGTFVKAFHKQDGVWDLEIDTELCNNYYEEKRAAVVSRIFDPNGHAVVCPQTEAVFPCQQVTMVRQHAGLQDPMLWSPDSCSLYTMRTEVLLDGVIVDTYETEFGVREITFDPNTGMYINGVHTKLYGFMSQDAFIGVGAAQSESMQEIKLRKLRDCGSNGFRTMHQAHPPETAYWCDRYGQLLMDENRIFHASEIALEQMERMVKRDRNHPSVIMWALYNEEDLIGTEEGTRMFRKIRALCKKLDPTRPVTGATSFGLLTEGAHVDHDLLGVNHECCNYARLHACKPDIPIFGSEMGGFTARGGWAMNGANGMPAAYDHLENDFCIGAYAISVGPFAITEVLDRVLNENEVWHLTKAGLHPETPYAKISPDWTFPEEELGKPQAMVVCNNGDHVELFLNGQSLGVQESTIYRPAMFTVPYEKGTLKAVVTKDGKPWAEDCCSSAGPFAKIVLECENLNLRGDNLDVAFIKARAADAQGSFLPYVTGPVVEFSCNEAGAFISGGSNPVRMRHEQGACGGCRDPQIDLFRGSCAAYFRSLAVDGDLVITARCQGCPDAVLTIPRSVVKAVPAVAEAPSNYVMRWHLSPMIPYEVDEEAIMRENCGDQWEVVDLLGVPDRFVDMKPKFSMFVDNKTPAKYRVEDVLYCVYFARSVIPALPGEDGKKPVLLLEGLDGISNVYVTGKNQKRACAQQKENPEWPGHRRMALTVDCSAFDVGEEVEIWVFVSDSCRTSGLTWPVRWGFQP